jgi:hypothetical protein
MPSRHFGATRSKKVEPITITIEAIPLDDNKDIEENEFTFMPEIPGGLLMEAAAMTGANGESNPAAALHLIESAVRPEDHGRLVSLLKSKDPYVTTDTVDDLFQWLNEQYAVRPTATRSGSSAGQRRTHPMSMGAGSERAIDG